MVQFLMECVFCIGVIILGVLIHDTYFLEQRKITPLTWRLKDGKEIKNLTITMFEPFNGYLKFTSQRES